MREYRCLYCGLVATMGAMGWAWHRLTVPGHVDRYGRVLSMRAAGLRWNGTRWTR